MDLCRKGRMCIFRQKVFKCYRPLDPSQIEQPASHWIEQSQINKLNPANPLVYNVSATKAGESLECSDANPSSPEHQLWQIFYTNFALKTSPCFQ